MVHVGETKEVKRVGEVGNQSNWLVRWDQLVWYQSEGAAVKHFAAKVLHKRLRLKMEIAQHFIRAPTA